MKRLSNSKLIKMVEPQLKVIEKYLIDFTSFSNPEKEISFKESTQNRKFSNLFKNSRLPINL